MRHNLFLFFLSTVFIASTSFSQLKSKKYEVEILQNGQSVPIIANTVALEKKEFKIKITLKKHDGVFMSASYGTNYFELTDQEPIRDYKWLNYKVRAESHFNEAKMLHISEETLSYYFYDKSQDWHRFDRDIIVKKKKVIGTKTVGKVYTKNNAQETLLKDVKNDIYLFFVATEAWKQDNPPPKELGRLKLKITWR